LSLFFKNDIVLFDLLISLLILVICEFMSNRWLNWVNLFILTAILLVGGGLFYFWANQLDEIVLIEPQSKQNNLPKSSFELSTEAYESISGSFLHLNTSVPTLQLPDLKTQLIYQGRNGRPDAQLENATLHFSLSGNVKESIPINLHEKTYLAFDKNNKQTHYKFSPGNEETGLWFETSLGSNNEIIVNVEMEDEEGKKITEPAAYAQFRLPEKNFVKLGGVWEIGTFRVDGTLLARLKARWYGQDRFLENHGGKEFADIEGKQRIDFSEGDDLYYVFVKVGDYLVWEDDRWHLLQPDENSTDKPILVVKKVDDRLMSFELWDVNGKAKVALNLLKSKEPWTTNNAKAIQSAFKFVGARTKTQSLFEINKVRMVIRPNDWLLMTSKGWKKLESAEDIDRYVQRKDVGMLFVFEGWKNKEDRQAMMGTLYNVSRSDTNSVELVMQNAKPKSAAKKPPANYDDDDDYYDDDDDDDDELIEKMLSSLKQSKESVSNKAKKDSEKKEQLKKNTLSKPTSQKRNAVRAAPVNKIKRKK